MDLSELKTQGSQVKQEVREKTLGYLLAALGLVAGLAWNEAIKAGIEYLWPMSQNTLWAKFGYALGITMVVVIMSFYLTKAIKNK